MNKHLYRIIFNKRRGLLMVVAENAGSGGKAASGEGEAAGASGARPCRRRSAWRWSPPDRRTRR